MRLLHRACATTAAIVLATGLAAWSDAGAQPPPVPDADTTTPGTDGPPPIDNTGPPPPPPALSYYVVQDGNRAGPFDEAALVELIRAGKLTAQTRVWTGGMADWQPAGGVGEMAALIEANRPVTPPPVTPPPPEPPAVQYFALVDGQQVGPMSPDQLKAEIAAGRVTRQTQVWTQGMTAWAAADSVPDIAALFPAEDPRRAAEFLAGRWIMDPKQVPVEGVGQGTLEGWGEYTADGVSKAQMTITYQQFGTTFKILIEYQGTAKAVFKDPTTIQTTEKGTMIFKRQRGSEEPMPMGVQPLNETGTLKVLDRNTVQDDEGVIMRRAGS